MPEANDIERGLRELESELKRLEAEYNMYFAGRLPKPPWETRSRVEALVRRYDRDHLNNYGDRFRFATLQARYAKLVVLWDRGLRAREEGRPGPYLSRRVQPAQPAGAHPRPEGPSTPEGVQSTLEGAAHSTPEGAHPAPERAHPASDEGVHHVAAFRDPMHQMDRLRELYQSVVQARRQVGGDAMPFDDFAGLVRAQVERLRTSEGAEVAFQVAVKDGKVSFTARVMKGGKTDSSRG